MSEVPPPPPSYPAQPTATPMSPEDQRLWATLTHVGGIVGVVVFGGGLGWVMPLITFLTMKERGGFIREHARAALNFHLTMLIAIVAGWILTIVIIGILVLIAVPILVIIFGIIASIRANKGEMYTYPLSIPFVK
ncbi:DUF4870 domain-containing protein [Herbiconiux sp. L3-i23]|uniref:DUF4870 domain-containing protein n=1 Tax=Herbiconiux sp. L3-i23 TaxID=2905871 RepID=UPI002047A4F1|nr:DUF4870 domain-containing protein [Herbiconiux sp. L3-i23]BDI23076.1 hypothetical protein L3i23_18520 [Herbiconiux sp. L3-i23]